jgi:indole-3-glycerol phosphate synthase
VIAEIKRSSPSKGAINPELDVEAQAKAYRAGGAAAISVLTEPSRFGGDIRDIKAALIAGLPILRKDFIVAEWQLTDAVEAGASAALIIVRGIEPARLKPLHDHALGLGLEILFEVRDEGELERALEAGAVMIGVNNRNLETLEIDQTTVERIVPLIPRGCVAVAESGYTSRSLVENAAAAGADAVLVGSSLSASPDPAASVRELTGVVKRSRG